MCMAAAARIASGKSTLWRLRCVRGCPVDMRGCLLSGPFGVSHGAASDCGMYLRLRFRVGMVLALDSWTR